MSVETFNNQAAESIREGDRVQDAYGRDFIAQSDAIYNDTTGDYDVLSPGLRWIAYADMDNVSLTYDTAMYQEDVYA